MNHEEINGSILDASNRTTHQYSDVHVFFRVFNFSSLIVGCMFIIFLLSGIVLAILDPVIACCKHRYGALCDCLQRAPSTHRKKMVETTLELTEEEMEDETVGFDPDLDSPFNSNSIPTTTAQNRTTALFVGPDPEAARQKP